MACATSSNIVVAVPHKKVQHLPLALLHRPGSFHSQFNYVGVVSKLLMVAGGGVGATEEEQYGDSWGWTSWVLWLEVAVALSVFHCFL